VAESPRGLVLVDPHAAHEKILYAELLAEGDAAVRESRAATSQLLLVDSVVSVEAAGIERLSESFDILAGLGFQIEPFGPGLIRCSAVPAATALLDPERLVRDLLDSPRQAATHPPAGAAWLRSPPATRPSASATASTRGSSCACWNAW